MATIDFSDLVPQKTQGAQGAPDFSDLIPQKPQGALQNFEQGAALSAGSAVSGVNRVLGAIGDVETGGQTLADKYLPTWLSRPGGGETALKAGPAPHIFPMSQDYQRATDYLGLTGHEWQKPQNEAQRLVGEGIAGAVSALPTALLGPSEAFIPAMAQGATGGVAAEGTRALGAPPAVQALAGAAGGSGTQLLQHIAAGDPVARVRSLLGGSTEMEMAGQHLQDAARIWRNEVMPNELHQAWAPIDQGIGPNAPTPIDNFHQTLRNMSQSAGSLAPITDELTPGLVDRLLGATNDRMAPVTTQLPPQARTVRQVMLGQYPMIPVGPAAVPTWDEVQQLRTAIGNAMSTPKIVEDIGQTRLNGLYAALTDDMRNSVGANGPPELMQAFEEANDRSRAIYAHANGPISKIISDPNVAEDPKIGAETAAKRLLSGDPQNLAALAQSMPRAVGQLASAFLSQTPEKWRKLTPAMKDALVPNETLQGILNQALPANPVNLKQTFLGGIGGATLGPEAAIAFEHFAHGTMDPVTSGALGGLAAGGLAVGTGLARGIANNPAVFTGPIRGAIASGASNALVPEGEAKSPFLPNQLTPPGPKP